MAFCRFWIIALVLLASVPAMGAQRAQVLEDILEQVRASYNKQERPMVIFDVDGTLLDNRTRIQRILIEYSDAELKKARPDEAKLIREIDIDKIEYRVADTLKGIGIDDSGIINNAMVFWGERFFTDDYLRYDVPTPGAVDFVRTLYSSGAKIVYLTGRDTERQLLGTVRTLREKGFPIGIQGTELIMKPTPQTQNAMFKQRVTNYLRHYGKVVATFDNEPGNINVYRRAFGKAICILFQAKHSLDAPPLLPNINELASFEKIPDPAPIQVIQTPVDAAAQIEVEAEAPSAPVETAPVPGVEAEDLQEPEPEPADPVVP